MHSGIINSSGHLAEMHSGIIKSSGHLKSFRLLMLRHLLDKYDTVGQDEYKHKSFIAVKHRNTHNAVHFVSKTVPQNSAITRQSASQ
jgi:hypothetical protein